MHSLIPVTIRSDPVSWFWTCTREVLSVQHFTFIVYAIGMRNSYFVVYCTADWARYLQKSFPWCILLSNWMVEAAIPLNIVCLLLIEVFNLISSSDAHDQVSMSVSDHTWKYNHANQLLKFPTPHRLEIVNCSKNPELCWVGIWVWQVTASHWLKNSKAFLTFETFMIQN